MPRYRLVLAGITLLAALVVAIFAIFHHQYLKAFTSILTGVSLGWIILGLDDYMIAKGGLGIASAIALVSLFAAFPSAELTGARAEVQNNFLTLIENCKGGDTGRIRKIEDLGPQACGLQGVFDLLGLIDGAAKELYLSPGVGLASDLANLNEKKDPDNCALTFVAAERMCPDAFATLSSKSRDILKKTAHGDD